LRREELAMLAGISAEYYLRLERGRAQHPSPQILDALARALQLDAKATQHLYDLAGPSGPATCDRKSPDRPLAGLVDQFLCRPLRPTGTLACLRCVHGALTRIRTRRNSAPAPVDPLPGSSTLIGTNDRFRGQWIARILRLLSGGRPPPACPHS
jgi:hypothetical protein